VTLSGRLARVPWALWRRLPAPWQRRAHGLIALGRRWRARSTSLPAGPAPDLPPNTVELPTRYGSFWLDATDEKLTPWIRQQATWEADVLRLLHATVQPGTIAVDVGANVGFHTVALSRLVGPSGHVHAFEPLPETLELLRANIWRHECTNVTVHATAVTDRAATAAIQVDREGRSGAHLVADGEDAAVVVPTVTLDGVLEGVRVGVLKVDVEGGEPLVLRGARQLVAAAHELLAIVEFRAARHLDGSSPEDVLRFYEELGFALYLLRSDGNLASAGALAILDAAAGVETLNIVLRKQS
jgi:FkbM family methyltransferase